MFENLFASILAFCQDPCGFMSPAELDTEASNNDGDDRDSPAQHTTQSMLPDNPSQLDLQEFLAQDSTYFPLTLTLEEPTEGGEAIEMQALAPVRDPLRDAQANDDDDDDITEARPQAQ